MYKPLIYLISISLLISCVPEKQKADLVITNAKIYTVDETGTTAEAFAVRDGSFIAVGGTQEILDQYESDERKDPSTP